jgi:hypothetical protein
VGDGERIALLVAPIWTQSSVAVEDRPAHRLLGDAGRQTWSEWNFETTNTRSKGDPATYRPTPDDIPPMSVGHMASLGGLHGRPTAWRGIAHGNPVLGAGAPQHCSVTDDEGRTRTAPPTECFAILTGTSRFVTRDGSPWRPYVYFMARVTAQGARFFLLVRDEDEQGRLATTGGGRVVGFRQMEMATPEFIHYVTPQPMSAFISLFFDCEGEAPYRLEPGERKAIDVDWFLYTPEASRDPRAMIADVADLQRYLDRASTVLSRPAPRRINSLRYSDTMPASVLGAADGFVRLDNGYTLRPAQADPCQPDIERPLRPSQGFDFFVEGQRTPDEGRTIHFLQAVPVESLTHRTRHAAFRVTWTLPIRDRMGVRDSVVTGHGFAVRIDPHRLAADRDIRVNVEQVHHEDGRWRSAPPACGTGDGDRMRIERRVRYDAATGRVVEVRPAR